MKYIKVYEELVQLEGNEDIIKFQAALCELAKEFFENLTYTTRIKNKTVEFRTNEDSPYPETFFFVELLYQNYNFVYTYAFNIGKNYVEIEDWKKTIEFEKYLISLIKPFSYTYNKNYDHYYVMDSKFKELIKEMDIDKYKLNKDANKYNL